ncbi:extracellular solute-binding protein [Phytoactinopolyspora alkaliphila]|uniref:Extracellular solute-binding protein n=1 Tax=Phytoactinopolyspora alkaliphila TaxID=1783498 RepID=A0A6N9YSA6_9ACTN|nr:extracellular solute-binding protein [Phytoactinopolyspora alkaliphila]NED97854.1 extracellular solute-binding protein [Phytoactinopolyspora alkaliphila]
MKKPAILLAGIALATTACVGGGENSDQPDDVDAAAAASPATGSLRFESWTPTADTMDTIVEGFESENPDVNVEVQLAPYEDHVTALRTQLRAGEGPDVFVVEPGAMFHQFRQYTVPIDAFATASSGDDWAAGYRPEALDRARADDATFGLPLGYGIAGFLWVNQTILDDVGVDAPSSYDDLVETSEQIVDAGYQPIALGAQDAWMNIDYFMAIANGIDSDALYAALEGEGSWTSEPLVDAFSGFQRMFDDGVIQAGAAGATTYNTTYDMFANGQAAFFANGSWNLDMFVNSLDEVGSFEIDVVPFPVPGTDQLAPVTGDVTGIIVVNKDSDNQAAAFRLAEYMSRGAGAKVWADAFLDFPVVTEDIVPERLPEQAGPARSSIEELANDSLAGYRQVPSPAVSEALGQALTALAAGSTQPEEAASRVQDAADDAG